MADPYLPPQAGRPASITNPNDPAYVTADNRVTVVPERSGPGMGVVVAVLFVLGLILAAVFYNRDTPAVAPVPAPAATDVPAAEAPAADVPAAEPPVADAPATDAPPTDVPATEPPAADAPAVEGGTVTPDPAAPVPPANP